MIAILGATGYVGRSLARRLAAGGAPMVLFARDPARLVDEPWPSHVMIRELSGFTASGFDVVVNAIGASDPARVAALRAEIVEVTRTWDGRVLATMDPRTCYVFVSSGAVHGALADPGAAPPYTMAKLHAEARHRRAAERSIVDVRVFAYADASIPLTGGLFLATLARSVARGVPFVTAPGNMWRDYAGADELADLVRCWTAAGAPNAAVDLYSSAPVSKLELLAEVRRRYGIDVDVRPDGAGGPSSASPVYVSHDRGAAAFGYAPTRTSLEIVIAVLDRLRAAAPATGPVA